MAQPLFSPSSTFWKINRELASGLAGPRAVLMQISHPLIAAGVYEHSRYREHRFARLYRTSMAAAAITFGSRELALRTIAAINKRHESIHGVLRAQSGIFPAGTPYDANDPGLKLWVLNTITDSTLLVYDLFIAPLSLKEREEYYDESIAVARLFDIPDSLIPPTYAAFSRYMARMLASGEIAASHTAQQIARELFEPSFEGRLLFLGSGIGIGLLPEFLRTGLGFKWTDRHQRWLQNVAAFSRAVRGRMPATLCANPMATWSHLRMRTSRGRRRPNEIRV
jgi:uncharacterized protein (DUF2236 family)